VLFVRHEHRWLRQSARLIRALTKVDHAREICSPIIHNVRRIVDGTGDIRMILLAIGMVL